MLMLAVASFLASGCTETESQAQPAHDGPPERGGTVFYGMYQQPPVINTKLVQGGMAAASVMVDPLMDAPIRANPDGTWYPVLIEGVPTLENGMVDVGEERMEFTFRFREEAAWSDGMPVVCADFSFTWETHMDDRWMIRSREGWDLIEEIQCIDEKTTRVVLREHYAPFLSTLLGGYVLPRHELEGKDFNKYWNAQMTVTNGPFRFKRWQRNVMLELERDPNYWNRGEQEQPFLDGITFVFLKDVNSMKVQLRTGEIDIIAPPADSSLAEELSTYPRADFMSEAGSFWEHFAFNHRNPPLDDVDVRTALPYAIDRRQITDAVMRRQVEPLQSTQLPAVERYYEPAWERFQPDADKVAEHMTAAGFERQGQWWTKDGKRVSLLMKTTAGNPLRMKVSQVLQQQLRAQGFDMRIQMETAEVFFGQTTGQGTYDIGVWAWGSGVDPSQKLLFTCDQIPTKSNEFRGNNKYGYCNEEVDRLFDQADAELDDTRRAELTREIQRLMADDAVLMPVFQQPETIAYSHSVYGIEQNVVGGLFWRIGQWYTVVAR